MTEKKHLYYLIILLLITFFVTSLNIIQFFFERASFQYSDWLINYQAGFVRRGLIGEIFFQISNLSKLRLDFLILFFVLSLYVIFYLNFFKIIKKINLKIIDFFIILSPLSFFYTAFEQKASGRKEIIFLSFLSLFIIMIKKIPQNKQIFVIILLTTITSLTHSGLIFYNIYFLILFACFNYKLGIEKIILKSIPFIFSSAVILTLISLNSTLDEIELKTLCQSVSYYLPNCGKGDYINTLTWGLKNNFEGNKFFWFSTNYFISYFLSFIFCFIFFIYMSVKSKIKNLNFVYLVFICLVATLPLYFIGADYGRYLHISYISSILIYYFLLSEKIIKRQENVLNIKQIFIVPIIIIYSFTWTVPHCCEDNPKFNYRKLIN